MKYLILFIALNSPNFFKTSPSSYEIRNNFTDKQIKDIETEVRDNFKINVKIDVLKRNNKDEIVHLIYTKYNDFNGKIVTSGCESDNFGRLLIKPTGCSISDK